MIKAIRENTLHSIMDGHELQPYSYSIMSATQVTNDGLTYIPVETIHL